MFDGKCSMYLRRTNINRFASNKFFFVEKVRTEKSQTFFTLDAKRCKQIQTGCLT